MAPHRYQQLDPTDRAIVDALRQDGRRPYREIARDLGVSESKVRKRAKRLLDSGYIRILAMSNAIALGVPVLATTFAKVSPGTLQDVAERLSRDRRVRYLAVGVGGHNLVFESLHVSNTDLHGFIQSTLGMDGIISSETMQVVKIEKAVWDWEVPQPAPD